MLRVALVILSTIIMCVCTFFKLYIRTTKQLSDCYNWFVYYFRGNGRINSLAVLDDTGVAMNTMFLHSSVLVTGALLVGTRNCDVVGNSINVNASNRIPLICKNKH